MKNILLPTDFSINSQNAITYAMELFKKENCTFYLLHVQKASSYTSDDLMAAPSNSSIHQSVLINANSKLIKEVEILKKTYKNEKHVFKTLTDFDILTDAIKQAIKAKNINLVIMGTNGATGANEVVFGSNTLNVIRKVDCPVIAVPQGFIYKKPKTILFTMDYNDHFTAEGIMPLMDVISKFKASLKILKIKEDDVLTVDEFDDKRNMKDFFKDINHTFHSITNVPTALAIDSFVQLMKVDMNAMFIHKETFFDRLFNSSTSSKVSYGTRVPLLIMRS